MLAEYPRSPGYNSGMDHNPRPLRQPLWSLLAVVLAMGVGFFGYELRWVYQRRAEWREHIRWLNSATAGRVDGACGLPR